MFQEGKQEMPCSCIKPEFSLIYKDRHDSNRILQITFFMSSKLQILESLEPEPLFFSLEPEQTQVGRSQSRLWDLQLLELETPKKVAAPQHRLQALIKTKLGQLEGQRRRDLRVRGHRRTVGGLPRASRPHNQLSVAHSHQSVCST